MTEPFTIIDGLRCFYRMYAARFGKTRWGDKTPAYNTCLLPIKRFLPEAYFIHIIRDGRDVAVSSRIAGARQLQEHAENWRDSIRETRRQGAKCRHYLELRYEDLVRSTRQQLLRISEFLHLTFQPQMQQYHRVSEERLKEWTELRAADGRLVCTLEDRLAAHHLLVKEPDTGRIERWRTVLTSRDIMLYESLAGDVLAQCQYMLTSRQAT